MKNPIVKMSRNVVNNERGIRCVVTITRQDEITRVSEISTSCAGRYLRQLIANNGLYAATNGVYVGLQNFA